MLELVLIVVLIIVGKFFYDWNKQNKQIAQVGGVRRKYEKLTARLLEYNKRLSIVQEDPSSITIGTSVPGGTYAFTITETFGTVTVEWKSTSATLGSHQIEWEFPTSADQDEMFDKIQYDLDNYQRRILTGSQV